MLPVDMLSVLPPRSDHAMTLTLLPWLSVDVESACTPCPYAAYLFPFLIAFWLQHVRSLLASIRNVLPGVENDQAERELKMDHGDCLALRVLGILTCRQLLDIERDRRIRFLCYYGAFRCC